MLITTLQVCCITSTLVTSACPTSSVLLCGLTPHQVNIDCDILEWQAKHGWGAKVIERLAHDLRTAFPNMKGFSRANQMYMHAFAEAWPDAEIIQ
ncbi:MAG: DUF1016 N-terminal domain-containing protein [Methylotenera sp.]|nr:DUF1016 N-terminal domain-containing protein [Methylotenera sp.]